MLIGPILNKIELFKNVKISKRCMDCGTHTLDVHIFFLVNFGVFEWLYLVDIGPINIKLENVANLNLLSLTMWVSTKGFVPSPSRFESDT